MKLAKHYNVQPSEVDRMPYWEYEVFLEEVNQDIKEENKRNDTEQKRYGDMNPDRLMKSARSSMPKMPSGSGTPKIPSMPRF